MQSVRFVLRTVCPIRTICPPLIKAVRTICLRTVCPRQIRAKKQSVRFVFRTICLQTIQSSHITKVIFVQLFYPHGYICATLTILIVIFFVQVLLRMVWKTCLVLVPSFLGFSSHSCQRSKRNYIHIPHP